MENPDVLIRNEGSIWLFTPMSDDGRQWIENNVDREAQWFGGSLVCEHRYGPDLAEGMIDYGLNVAGT